MDSFTVDTGPGAGSPDQQEAVTLGGSAYCGGEGAMRVHADRVHTRLQAEQERPRPAARLDTRLHPLFG
jgi:hypothetical protein